VEEKKKKGARVKEVYPSRPPLLTKLIGARPVGDSINRGERSKAGGKCRNRCQSRSGVRNIGPRKGTGSQGGGTRSGSQ